MRSVMYISSRYFETLMNGLPMRWLGVAFVSNVALQSSPLYTIFDSRVFCELREHTNQRGICRCALLSERLPTGLYWSYTELQLVSERTPVYTGVNYFTNLLLESLL